jgi:hypothetical protein
MFTNSLLRVQSDGTTSHSTRSPKNGNQVAGYAVSCVGSGHRNAVSHRLRRYEPTPQLRCHSHFAYLQSMSQCSLRGSLHLELLVTALGENQ